jgi:hypothetical protein
MAALDARSRPACRQAAARVHDRAHSFAPRSTGAINDLDGFIDEADGASPCWRRIAALP